MCLYMHKHTRTHTHTHTHIYIYIWCPPCGPLPHMHGSAPPARITLILLLRLAPWCSLWFPLIFSLKTKIHQLLLTDPPHSPRAALTSVSPPWFVSPRSRRYTHSSAPPSSRRPPAAAEVQVRSARLLIYMDAPLSLFLSLCLSLSLSLSLSRAPRYHADSVSGSPVWTQLIRSFITNGVRLRHSALPLLPSLRSHRSARCIGICSPNHGGDTGQSHIHTHTHTRLDLHMHIHTRACAVNHLRVIYVFLKSIFSCFCSIIRLFMTCCCC